LGSRRDHISLIRAKTRLAVIGGKCFFLMSSVEAFRPRRVFSGIFKDKNKPVAPKVRQFWGAKQGQKSGGGSCTFQFSSSPFVSGNVESKNMVRGESPRAEQRAKYSIFFYSTKESAFNMIRSQLNIKKCLLFGWVAYHEVNE
jgi:hypothetical protein